MDLPSHRHSACVGMVSEVSVRCRLMPTPHQATVMERWGDHTRFVWNEGVARVREVFDHPQAQPRHSIACDTDPSRRRDCARHDCPPRWMPHWLWREAWNRINALSGLSTELRRTHSWLAAGPAVIQQDVERDLRRAFENWLRPTHPARRPRYRRRGHRVSFNLRRPSIERAGDGRSPAHGGGKLNAKWRIVHVPKIGAVKFRCHRPLPADLSSARVVREPGGDWFISFVEQPPARPHTLNGRIVGIDMGIANSVTVHDGTTATRLCMPELLTEPERKRLRRLEREAARRHRPGQRHQSGGWHDTQRHIAKLHTAQTRRRNDWIEKTTTALIDGADVICRENLRVPNMTRSAKGSPERPGTNVAAKSGLNRAILSQAWGRFAARLEDKARPASVTIIAIDPANTSRRCPDCGHTDAANRPTQELFRCCSCGHHDDADANAARNIRRQGMSSLRGRPQRGEASEPSLLALETLPEGTFKAPDPTRKDTKRAA